MNAIVRSLAERWNFHPTEELPEGYCSRVYADDTRVLKVPWRGEEMTTGRIAAERMSGHLGATVFESDEATGSLLMERLGAPLSEKNLTDEEGVGIFATIARELRGLNTDGLMDLRDYLPRPDPWADRLFATTERTTFLHGDLHHQNILRAPDGWRAIDPKGLVGDPAYEAAAYVHNPIDGLYPIPDLTGYLRRRIRLLAQELEVEPFRVWGWSMVLGVDGHDPEDRQAVRVMASLRELEAELVL